MRVLNIKETGKTRGGHISGGGRGVGGGLLPDVFFQLFTGGWAYSQRRGACKQAGL